MTDDLKISKLNRFRFDFFCKNLDFDYRSEFLLYRLATHARGQSLMVGRFVDQRSVRSAHIKRSENLTRARSDSDSCVVAKLRVRLTVT